ncbi:MAG: hypothetical protein HY712_03190 [candidate division NC10 bacterium]|nr:hypothetical protein [candidate division NC10 bacterium]
MTPSPIRKVLSIFRKHRVRALLMGGQACIAYGAAEFSRDVDLAVLCSANNLARLRQALGELAAVPVFVPPLDESYLRRGHACHFRCQAPEVAGLRVDIMSVLRGCEDFAELWQRRETISSRELGRINLLALPDLVAAKKTQRDKDWPMIRRLLEADYFRHRRNPRPGQVDFWLRELRTPELLVELVRRRPARARRLETARPLLRRAATGDLDRLGNALEREQEVERAADRTYWAPLRRELGLLRRSRHA